MSIRVISNRFGNKCQSCRVNVAEATGFAFKKNGSWGTCCNSAACMSSLGIKKPSSTPQVAEIKDLGDVFGFFTPYSKEALPILRGMPSARWNPENSCWTTSKDPADRPQVIKAAKRLNITVVPDGFWTVDTSSIKSILDHATKIGAYSYQLAGIEHLAMKKKALLADDMGLGKTFQSLLALDGQPVVVICPASLKFNWAKEVAMWRKDYTSKIVMGSSAKKKDARQIKKLVAPKANEIIICNYEQMPKWLKKGGKENGYQLIAPAKAADLVTFEALKSATLIVDEGHLCKNYKAARTKRMTALSELVDRVWALTGTPLLNRPMDLWGTLSAFGMQRIVFGSWGGMLKTMNGGKTRFGYTFGEAREDAPEKLRRVMLRRMKTEVLDLPPKRWSDLVVPASKEVETILNEFDLPTSGLPAFDKFSAVRSKMAKERIPAAIEWAESYEEAGEAVVVFSAHRAPVKALGEREGWAMIMGDTPNHKRQDIVDQFQAGELKGVALTIGAGSTGLTLTAASTMLFVDLDWNPSNNSQCEDRICRIGQTKSCLYVRMVSEHPLDLHIQQLLSEKKALTDAAVENEVELDEDFELKFDNPELPEIKEESWEEMEARIKGMGKGKLQNKVEENRKRWLARISDEIVVTDEIRHELTGALASMQDSCDGAKDKDGIGFNKPDAAIMHTICSADMLSDAELEKFVLWTLRKYKGQLGSRFPILFRKNVANLQDSWGKLWS